MGDGPENNSCDKILSRDLFSSLLFLFLFPFQKNLVILLSNYLCKGKHISPLVYCLASTSHIRLETLNTIITIFERKSDK